jgi:hypothetical protein
LFPLSLSESAFSWFTSLPMNSIFTWDDLEKKFHKYFYTGISEMTIIDLAALKQCTGEMVSNYIQRFRDTRS